MAALPPMAEVLRYGSVRQTDTGMLAHAVDGLVARICIGLPSACASLDDEAANQMFTQIVSVQAALVLLQNLEYTRSWQQILSQMSDQSGLHGLLAGRIQRILLDEKALSVEEAARRMSRALSLANPPAQSAAWLEGFLKDSGALLLHDPTLWQVLDEWVAWLPDEAFLQILPLLRRTFATFQAPERRRMGEKARQSSGSGGVADVLDRRFDSERARAVLPVLEKLLRS
jgi:hypothetical protein